MLDSTPDEQQSSGDTLELACSQLTVREATFILSQARSGGDPRNIYTSLIQLAHLHFRQGHYDQTQTLAAEVLRDAQPDSRWYCDALRILGNCAAELGDPNSAETYYHQASDLARQIDYPYALYKCLHSLATNIYWPRGQFDLCLAAGKEALAQAQSLDLGEELWFPLSDIAWAYWSTGQWALAKEVAEQMQAVVTPGSLGEGFYDCLQAGLMIRQDDFLNIVLPLYERARSIAETTGDPGLNVEVRLGLSRSYRLAGDLPAALLWADDAVQNVLRTNYGQFQAAALVERGRMALEMGDLARAILDLENALQIATQCQANFDQTRAALFLSAVLFAQHSPEANNTWRLTAQWIQTNGYEFLLEEERSLVLPLIAAGLDSADPELIKTSQDLFERVQTIPATPMHVKLLGSQTIRVGSRFLSKEALRQRRAGELLAILLVSHGKTQTVEQISETMCPEKDPDSALDFYHHALSALRRLLEPDLPDRRFPCRYLEVDEERVRLVLPVGSSFDWEEFERAVKQKNWSEAIDIYGGEFLPSLRYAEWTIPIRQHLADQFESALLKLAEGKLQDGNPTACLELIRQALQDNPWQERAVELGMQAAIALGDRISALQLYQRLEKVLMKELGIAPQKELQLLYAAVKKRAS